ncbi:MAG TPA: DUF1127 domain-containing protein [Alphaproteobacteria bacterium]|nr:DUF1127 domain-containing protein [Alphaproteobacteria bacterium]
MSYQRKLQAQGPALATQAGRAHDLQAMDLDRVLAQARALRAQQVAIVFGGIARRVKALFAGFGEQMRERQAIAQLRGMDSRMLADIGLNRTEIEVAVKRGRPADTTFGQVDRGIARDKLAQAADNEWKSAA